MIKELLLVVSLAFPESSYFEQYVCGVTYDNDATARSSNPFVMLGGFDRYKVLDSDDGYVYYCYEVYKSEYTSNSNLYLVHTINESTPGHVARANGDTDYKDYYLDEGYVHIALEKYVDGSNHGGDIVVKDFWPKSNDFTMTVSSSFGGSATFGQSFSEGVELGNGMTITGNKTGSSSLVLNFSKSKSTVTDDPVLSTQLASDNSLETQWSYNVSNIDPAGMVTYSLDTYVLFEMQTNFFGDNEDVFIAEYTVQIKNYHSFIYQWYVQGLEFTSSVRISNFI